MLIATNGIRLPLRDIKGEGITKVVAGNNMIVAITNNHHIRFIPSNPDLPLSEFLGIRVEDVAISKIYNGLCIGLLEDGTCRLLYCITAGKTKTQNSQYDEFRWIDDTIRRWRDVVQLVVSDAIFALHIDGRVSCCEFSRHFMEPSYGRVQCWEGIRKLVVGSQCSVAGITHEGTILVDGQNMIRNQDRIVNSSTRIDIADIIMGGSECERILFLDKGGRICDFDGEAVYPGIYRDVLGNWDYTLLARDYKHKLHVLDPGCFHIANEGECEAWGRVSSYAILNQGFNQGAVVAVCENKWGEP